MQQQYAHFFETSRGTIATKYDNRIAFADNVQPKDGDIYEVKHAYQHKNVYRLVLGKQVPRLVVYSHNWPINGPDRMHADTFETVRFVPPSEDFLIEDGAYEVEKVVCVEKTSSHRSYALLPGKRIDLPEVFCFVWTEGSEPNVVSWSAIDAQYGEYSTHYRAANARQLMYTNTMPMLRKPYLRGSYHKCSLIPSELLGMNGKDAGMVFVQEKISDETYGEIMATIETFEMQTCGMHLDRLPTMLEHYLPHTREQSIIKLALFKDDDGLHHRTIIIDPTFDLAALCSKKGHLIDGLLPLEDYDGWQRKLTLMQSYMPHEAAKWIKRACDEHAIPSIWNVYEDIYCTSLKQATTKDELLALMQQALDAFLDKRANTQLVSLHKVSGVHVRAYHVWYDQLSYKIAYAKKEATFNDVQAFFLAQGRTEKIHEGMPDLDDDGDLEYMPGFF